MIGMSFGSILFAKTISDLHKRFYPENLAHFLKTNFQPPYVLGHYTNKEAGSTVI